MLTLSITAVTTLTQLTAAEFHLHSVLMPFALPSE